MILTDSKVGVGIGKNNAELAKAVFDALTALRASSEEAIYDKYHFDYAVAMPFEILTNRFRTDRRRGRAGGRRGIPAGASRSRFRQAVSLWGGA